MKKVSIIIPAAGSGQRFGAKKQFWQHHNKTLLEWTLKPIAELRDRLRHLVLVLAKEDHNRLPQHLNSWGEKLILAEGGPTRQESVYQGIQSLQDKGDDDIWLVHDAARPLVQTSDLHALADCIEEHNCGALLGLRVQDTLKRERSDQIVKETLDRSDLWRAQTPQGATASLLLKAFQEQSDHLSEFTDDASILETSGIEVRLVEGHPDNFKITTPEDWTLFQKIVG